jgi:hypothetical protein
MHKSATKCNETLGRWCKNKHGASKIIDMFETYHPSCPDFPVIQYADDTLIVLKANANHLFCLKALLLSFAESTGLKVNYSKSNMFPINMDEERLSHFTNTLNCQKGSFPFTYLGLKLGLTKPTLEHFMPMVVRVEKILCVIADFLDYGGKLLMVKSVLSSLPISYMSCLEIPVTINEQVIKYMRHCLWRNIIQMYKQKVLLLWLGKKFVDQRHKEGWVFLI